MLSYKMYRYEIIAPKVTNAGEYSYYPETFRKALLDNNIDGWTENDSMGYWRGKAEPGTTFTILRMTRDYEMLGAIARDVMTDQGDIQVTYCGTQDVYEA